MEPSTNVFDMLVFNPDALIVSDDGITNDIDVQFALDNELVTILNTMYKI